MRKIITLLLTFAMALSLVVIAGATETGNGSVSLKPQKKVNGNTVTYTFTLDASNSKGVGALEFYVKPTGLEFKKRTFPEGQTLKEVFEGGNEAGEGLNGTADFKGDKNYFIAYGGNADKNRVLTGTVDLVSVTYTITDSNYSLEVTSFKACLSGEQAALKDTRYDCVAEPVDGGKGDYDITAVGKNTNIPAYTLDGTNLTVTYSLACAVAYSTNDGETYTRIKVASGSGDSYVFDLSVAPDKAKIIIVVKGDANGDGTISNADVTRTNAIALGKAKADARTTFAADANTSGDVSNADVTRLNAVALNKSKLSWDK